MDCIVHGDTKSQTQLTNFHTQDAVHCLQDSIVCCLVIKSCPTLCDLLCAWDSRGKNTGVGCHFLLQGIFPTQGSNPGLPHFRRILYQLSHKGRPRILELIPIPCPVDLPNPGIQPRSPVLQADSLPTELSGKP